MVFGSYSKNLLKNRKNFNKTLTTKVVDLKILHTITYNGILNGI